VLGQRTVFTWILLFAVPYEIRAGQTTESPRQFELGTFIVSGQPTHDPLVSLVGTGSCGSIVGCRVPLSICKPGEHCDLVLPRTQSPMWVVVVQDPIASGPDQSPPVRREHWLLELAECGPRSICPQAGPPLLNPPPTPRGCGPTHLCPQPGPTIQDALGAGLLVPVRRTKLQDLEIDYLLKQLDLQQTNPRHPAASGGKGGKQNDK
jgi:hypothetical protein